MKHRILIVEDNILLAGQQKKWFEKSGYEAVTTIDEPGARRLLKKEPFDLVLSDVRLPQGDGIYNPQIQISVVSGTKRSIFRQKNKTKRSKKRLHTTLIKPEQKVNEDLCSGFIVS